jgi:hypothetical protein
MHLNKQLKSQLKKHKQNTREILGNPITKDKDTKIWYFGQSAISDERAR